MPSADGLLKFNGFKRSRSVFVCMAVISLFAFASLCVSVYDSGYVCVCASVFLCDYNNVKFMNHTLFFVLLNFSV